MALHTLKDYYPNYQNELGNSELRNIESYGVYAEGDNHVGSVKDLLVDDSGRFRYVVVDTGPWIFGKTVLLPIGLAHFDYQNNRIYVNGLSQEQVKNLPEFKRDQMIDERYETQVQEGYRPLAQRRTGRQYMANQAVETERSVESSAPVEGVAPVESDAIMYDQAGSDRMAMYDREPAYYGLSEQDNQGPLRLYEERLMVNRRREKVGEVRVGKHVVTETREISEPVTKERVVVERHAVNEEPVAGTPHNFQDQEVARMDVYEERIDIDKQPVVRESVTVRKETEQENVKAKETIRREELDIDTEGNPNVRR